MLKLLIIVVNGLLIAVGLGTVFSRTYPTVEIDVSLGFLFTLIGLVVALAIYGAWQAIWRKKT